jgi:hypothetical protein
MPYFDLSEFASGKRLPDGYEDVSFAEGLVCILGYGLFAVGFAAALIGAMAL